MERRELLFLSFRDGIVYNNYKNELKNNAYNIELKNEIKEKVMKKEEINKELIEKVLSKIELSKIKDKYLLTEYYLIYKNEFYPPEYVIEQCGYKNGTINSQEAVHILRSKGFKICNSNTNNEVLKIILRNFYKRAIENSSLNTKDIIRKAMYKDFKIHASFGKGGFAKEPFIVFLKDENTTQNGVYPYTSFLKENNSIRIGLGLSNHEESIKLMELAEIKNEDIEKLKEEIRENEFFKENLNDIEELTDEELNEITEKIDHYIDKYNNLFPYEPKFPKNERKKETYKIIPKNQILFGPPGTGKTYSVVDKVLEIIEGRNIEKNEKRENLVTTFNKYKEEGQIIFTTFHQSYGYEEFIEGLRSNEDGNFVPTNGIFKDLCEKSKMKKKQKSSYEFDEKKINVFKLSLGNTQKLEDVSIYDYCIENNVVSLGYGYDIDYSNCSDKNKITEIFRTKYPNEPEYNIKAMETFKHKIKKNDLILVSNGNRKCRAIAKIIGDYNFENETGIEYMQFREVEWLYNDVDIEVSEILNNKNFSQKTLYQLNNYDINFNKIKNLLSKSEEENEKNYVIIIDEINRGNISKIFGELITLIEDDKREGAENELSVMLPYSKNKFSIPPNVYIVGTMNTADRSIALLDTALRRRFTFIEMMPQAKLLIQKIEDINLSEVLSVMNDRIEFLFDREHTIGHAYFINCTTFKELQKAMVDKVIPLLQEYFYDEWEKIELILGGCGSHDNQDEFFIYKKELNKNIFNKNDILSELIDEKRAKYFVIKHPSKEAFFNLIGKKDEDN